MKKLFSLLLIFTLLACTTIPSSSVQPSVKLTLDGNPVSFDTPPFIENGRTLVPFRAIFEALGATVEWNESTRTVTGTKAGTKISLIIDSRTAFVNDIETSLDVPAKIANGRTFVPARFIAENFDIRVYWDNIANTVVLLTDAIDRADDGKYLSKAELSTSTKGTITMWHFNENEAPLIADAFEKQYPNIDFRLTVISDKDSQYLNKLTAAVRSGYGVPDIMSSESAMVKRFVNMENCYYDITDKVGDITGNMYPYTVDVGRDEAGRIRALSHQITSAGIGYKRNVAKKYLGTDSEPEISRMLSTPQLILETAEKLKKNSGGKVALFPSHEELKKLYLGGRSKGWVVDNKLNIDQKVLDYIDIAKTFRSNKYESGFDQWSYAWSSAIAADETAMCWFIPTWGIPWIIGSNDRKSVNGGRWGLAKAAYSSFWGGTWYGVSEASQNKDIALGLVRYFVSDENHLKEWSSNTGDLPNSRKLIKQYGTGSSINDSITGQNNYKIFGDAAEKANGKLLTQYDDTIENALNDCMKSYLAGKISSRDSLISTFKNKVKSNLRDIVVR